MMHHLSIKSEEDIVTEATPAVFEIQAELHFAIPNSNEEWRRIEIDSCSVWAVTREVIILSLLEAILSKST